MPAKRPNRELLSARLVEAGCSDQIMNDRQLAAAGFVGRSAMTEMSQVIFWSPQPLPTGRATHLASSRLSKSLDCFPSWFDAVRTAASSLRSTDAFFLTAKGTTADRFVQRVGELFDVPVVRLRRFPESVSEAWIRQQRSLKQGGLRDLWFTAPPEINVDAWLIAIARDVRVLRVTEGGNVEGSIRERLDRERRQPPQPVSNAGRTWVLIDGNLSKSDTIDSLVNAGAMAWWLYRGSNEDRAEDQRGSCVAQSPTLGLDAIDPAEFLLHWTRRRLGPWPNQSEPAYLDDLIFRRPSGDHDALAALRQILVSQCMVAANDLTRSTTPVVCFSGVPLDQIEQHRKFRRHLGRWDFEPYGIAVKRSRLRQLNARPVIYGDDQDWDELPESDRPFFQVATSRDGQHDWRLEREWRICGDVPLRQIAAQDAVVFVPSREDAAAISPLSRWPVVVLD